MNQTTVVAVGTVITPTKLRYLTDGTPVANFRIACNDRRFDRESGEWIDRDTFYVTVSCWRRLAENVCVSLRSGDPVIVRGRLFTRSYDVEGRRNSVTEMEADVVAPDLTRATAVVTRVKRSNASSPMANGLETGNSVPWGREGVAVHGVAAQGVAARGEPVGGDAAAEPERELVDAVPASSG